MADEQKQPWYKSLPGTLTAATGFVAALSGLVAGLNQLGVFKHEQPAPQAVVAGPSGGAAAPGAASGVASGGSSNAGGASARGEESSTAPAAAAPAESRQPAPSAGPERPTPSAPVPAKPAPSAPSSKPAAAPAPDTTAQPQRLTSGTSFELTVPGRTCATGGAGKRFTARLAAPVRVGNATVLPVGTTATLHLRKSGPGTPDIRLDSLVRQKQAVAVSSADVTVTRGADGACLRAGARLAVELGAPVTLRR